MKKRSLSLLLALVLLVSLTALTGCKSNDSKTPTQSITAYTLKNEKDPVATITMENGGVITVELYPDVAPNTVANFITLANQGFYDGLIFHRVIKGFMIQGGDPNGNGTGGSGYSIKGEFSANGFDNNLSHTRGVISMARQGNPYFPAAAYNTAGSQFFIMHADSDFLDKDYAAFGEVIEGMDVVDAIATTDTDRNDKPLTEQRMKTVRVETFGVDYGEPEKIVE